VFVVISGAIGYMAIILLFVKFTVVMHCENDKTKKRAIFISWLWN